MTPLQTTTQEARKWPPLIYNARVSIWVKTRDVVLTLSAWVYIIFLLNDFIKLIYDYLKDPIFSLTLEDTPDWLVIWDKLGGFVLFSFLLILMITVAGITRKSIIVRSVHSDDQPEQAKIEKIESQYGVTAQSIHSWNEIRLFNVHCDEDGKILNIEVIPSITTLDRQAL